MRLAATIGLTVQSWPSTSRRRSSTTGSRMAASCALTTMCSWPSTRRWARGATAGASSASRSRCRQT
eukprot:scaffold489_cov96-Phaeocystis_antarctica.AAC.1